MADLKLFFKKNQKKVQNVKIAASEQFVDESGKPIEWEIRHLTSKEGDEIMEGCNTTQIVNGKPVIKFDNQRYIESVVASSCVFPDLLNAELQDNYGVKDAGDLLHELLPTAGEYQQFQKFVFDFQGLNKRLEDKIKEAKN